MLVVPAHVGRSAGTRIEVTTSERPLSDMPVINQFVRNRLLLLAGNNGGGHSQEEDNGRGTPVLACNIERRPAKVLAHFYYSRPAEAPAHFWSPAPEIFNGQKLVIFVEF